MGTIAIRDSRAVLRRWLGDSWALYFSHPNDFARYDFEADRWYYMLEDGFNAAEVRPLGPTAVGRLPGGSWIETVGGKLTDLPRLPRGKDRFVATYDSSLRLRRTFAYTAAQALPSPLDIAAVAVVLRQRAAAQNSRRALQLNRAAVVALVATASVIALARYAGGPSRFSAP